MFPKTFITCAFLATAYSQSQSFTCVPPGTCITDTGGGIGINPRIISQGSNAPSNLNRPAGTVPCFGQVGGSACGRRFVSGISTTDGLTQNGAYPWQAFIRNQTGYTGSGVLVNANTVLTAAHKVYLNRENPGNIQVSMGVWNPTNMGTAQMRTVMSMRINPNFNPSTLRSDIAVLRLNQPISLENQINVGTACLPAGTASYVGRRCLVSGWGQTGFYTNDAPTNPQKQVTVPIVNYETCRTSMAQPNVLGNNVDTYLDNMELCAGGEGNRDACTQDGGSPLVCESNGISTIAGLVIWGKNCGQPAVYGVYVDVAKYRSWIDSAINELSSG